MSNNGINGINGGTLTRNMQQEIQSVTFDTTASIDTTGSISLRSKVRNRNTFDKHKIHTVLKVISQGQIVYLLDSGYITLHGWATGIFVPTKKSSTVINKVGTLSFDGLSVEYPNAHYTDPDIHQKDREISDLSSKIRRIKVLSDAKSDGQDADLGDQLSSLSSQMSKAKEDRMRKLLVLEQTNKFKTISLDIHHEVV